MTTPGHIWNTRQTSYGKSRRDPVGTSGPVWSWSLFTATPGTTRRERAPPVEERGELFVARRATQRGVAGTPRLPHEPPASGTPSAPKPTTKVPPRRTPAIRGGHDVRRKLIRFRLSHRPASFTGKSLLIPDDSDTLKVSKKNICPTSIPAGHGNVQDVDERVHSTVTCLQALSWESAQQSKGLLRERAGAGGSQAVVGQVNLPGLSRPRRLRPFAICGEGMVGRHRFLPHPPAQAVERTLRGAFLHRTGSRRPENTTVADHAATSPGREAFHRSDSSAQHGRLTHRMFTVCCSGKPQSSALR